MKAFDVVNLSSSHIHLRLFLFFHATIVSSGAHRAVRLLSVGEGNNSFYASLGTCSLYSGTGWTKKFHENGLANEVQLQGQQETLKTPCDLDLCNGVTRRIGMRFTNGTSKLHTRLRKNKSEKSTRLVGKFHTIPEQKSGQCLS